MKFTGSRLKAMTDSLMKERLKNQETLEGVSLSCKKILKKLSSFLLMHKDKQKGEDSFTYYVTNKYLMKKCDF